MASPHLPETYSEVHPDTRPTRNTMYDSCAYMTSRVCLSYITRNIMLSIHKLSCKIDLSKSYNTGAIVMDYMNKIRQIRIARSYTQADMAELLETTQQQYSAYENGRNELPIRPYPHKHTFRTNPPGYRHRSSPSDERCTLGN